MDIRSFFGGPPRSKPVAAPAPAATAAGDTRATTGGEEDGAKEAMSNNAKNISTASSTSEGSATDSSSAPITSAAAPMKTDPAEAAGELPKDLRDLVDWEAGAPVPYRLVAEAFERIGATTGRLEKESILSQAFRAVILTSPADLEPVAYLAFNHVFPAYEGLELGIGDALLVKAVVEATGRTKQAVEAAYKAAGDLGLVALQSRTNQGTLGFATKPKPLTVRGVLEELRNITRTTGSKSMDRKVAIIKKMMISCQGTEAKYLVRALQGKLRIGLAAQTVLVSLAHAVMQCSSRLSFYPNYLMHGTTAMSAASLISSKAASATASSSSKKAAPSSGGKAGARSQGAADDDDDAMSVGSGSDHEGEGEGKASSSGGAADGKKARRSRVIDDEEDEEEEGVAANAGKVEASRGKEEKKHIPHEAAPTTEDAHHSRGAEASKEQPKQEQQQQGQMEGTEAPPQSPVEILEKLVHEKEPGEARKLRDAFSACVEHKRAGGNASIVTDTLLELAVIAVKRAFSECPNLGMLIGALLSRPIYELYKACRLVPGIPVAPMLAKPSKEVADVLRRLSGQWFTMEYKYDGERAQVHLLSDGTVKIFSRNSEDNSLKYPDLMGVVREAKHPDVTSLVVDAEVVAYDREKRCLLPFQILSTRKRKVEDGEEDNQKVKIILQVFDILYLNDRSLLQESLKVRRDILRSTFVHTEGLVHFASGMDCLENGDTAPIEAFMQEACVAMCEGLMVKTLYDNATYEPSKRSLNWLKLKKDYINGMGVCDSVDLVVMGGYHGRGKRTNVYGAYLMGCYDPESDEYQSVCKVGTGFKDEDLQRLTEAMQPLIVSSGRRPPNYNTDDTLAPDDWFEPQAVWELQAADLSKSSVHRGGIGRLEAGRGIGLRFPRFLRERSDKKAEMATTAEQVLDMYHSQATTSGDAAGAAGGAAGEGDDDDDYI